MGRIFAWIGGGFAAVIVIALIALNVSPLGRIYLWAGTGLVAKQNCSLVFVSGMEEAQANTLYITPLLGDAASLIQYEINREEREVTASVLGVFWRQRAVWRDGLGCTLVHGTGDFDPDLAIENEAPVYFDLDTVHRDANFDTGALQAAVDAAFDDPNGTRNTLAVVVLHDGRLVAERYAEGLTRENRLHGWSMTKTAMVTLAGILTERGEIDAFEPGQVPALQGRGEDAEATTIDQLLRMTGGLAIAEINNGFDPNSDMLMTESDMARFAATRERLHPPGEHWQYMSGNTILATHAMQQRLGDGLAEQARALRDLFFEPLGMHSAILEPDETGTFQGSSYLYATPHDWARMMQLYVDDGLTRSGQRLIPDWWDDYVTTPTPGSEGDYGSGVWLDGDYLPDGSFHAQGFQGQYGYAIPERGLVVIRMGATYWVSTGSRDLAVAVVAAMRPQEISED
ncbi:MULTISPECIES: serine hydrolase domain-containing protein [Hyphobacterium]|uniref:Serine hydrolase domain-containing protein n=1 Tax=Hyphobacterium vulgare TaxID=1736751 RepID=A0ABV6ZYN7_9PROT